MKQFTFHVYLLSFLNSLKHFILISLSYFLFTESFYSFFPSLPPLPRSVSPFLSFSGSICKILRWFLFYFILFRSLQMQTFILTFLCFMFHFVPFLFLLPTVQHDHVIITCLGWSMCVIILSHCFQYPRRQKQNAWGNVSSHCSCCKSIFSFDDN